ncbi:MULTISPECIES: L-threonylcarbamoyladenylate synthase [Atopobiaceae]|uniref:L-threonylcarbamoyladenylate synthase n=1 Tax=Atopobiaceae TaxID=1643824 RepID=UPI0019501B44|nr:MULTISPECIES: L-threonylcarbamoyladenylate synthase [Atopobiaceae]MCR8908229.1 L-threonylcarbamoyladenylate synthase [Thermophilibacter sp. ET337]
MEVLLARGQDRPESLMVARVVEVLRDGGVAVLPTDSVYGICCAATPANPAHARIFEVKRRDRAQTLPWFVADVADLDVYGKDVPEWALRLAKHFWPGALTLVVRASEAVSPEYAQEGADGLTIALRVPGSELDRAIVRALGCPVAQTSANTHGEAAAASGAELEPGIAAAVDLVVDAGPAPVGVASTIVDATGSEPRILREGALTEAEVLLACRS